ncbi:ethylene response factor DREB1-3 [Artemisia annua]|uniref:Ethylene response factor DREB1-3 n=1 Tax=Artemisia annua TaxID=35608 RepID=A0A2U1P045_ARTAN|nr:ethylene response factor DREB1-3 [Artemisia annua]
MASAAMNFWNNNMEFQQTSSSAGGELMEALEPFIKSTSYNIESPNYQNTLPFSTPSTSSSFLPPTPTTNFQQPNFYPDYYIPQTQPEYQFGSIVAKLQAICQCLAEGRPVDGAKKSGGRKAAAAVKAAPPPEPVKTESESGNSSPSSDLTFPEFTTDEDNVWSENFSLEKYPSYEIDWGSI